MKVCLYSMKPSEQSLFEKSSHSHDCVFTAEQLDLDTVMLAKSCDVVSCFVTDRLDSDVLRGLADIGVKLISLRSAGYDHVDMTTAHQLGLTVAYVPSYSPNAIAEYAVGLLLALSRKITLAHDKVRAHNFSLQGQLGFNLQGKTVGVIGTGNIGSVFAKIMSGFDCQLLATDPFESAECKALGVTYTTFDSLIQQSDIISLHCPLNSETQHLIDADALSRMKTDVTLINTARGALIDTNALLQALQDDKIGALGMDVYEFEKPLFFVDRSHDVIEDKHFLQLHSFPNVLITGHQAFFSREAVAGIVETTLANLSAFEAGNPKNTL